MNYYSLLKRWQQQGLDENCTHFANGDVLKLKAQPGNAFPSCDVASVKKQQRVQQVNLTFCGLYGVDSPLPPHVNDLTLYDNQQSHSLREFLDVFNHRIYTLYFLAWKYFNVEFATELGDQRFNQLISSLLVVNKPKKNYDYPSALSMQQRFQNPMALADLIKRNFTFNRVEVKENQLESMLIDRPVLTSKPTFSLGDNASLGGVVFTKLNKVQVTIDCDNPEQLDNTLPSGSKKLFQFISESLGKNFSYRLIVRIKYSPAPVPMGANKLRVGVNTSLGDKNYYSPRLYFE